MTDRCKNITLPQTSFAGGKYCVHVPSVWYEWTGDSSEQVSLFLRFHRPQTKFAKVMFLHLSVILFTGGVLSQHAMGQTPPRKKPGSPPPPRATSGRYASYWNAYLLPLCILSMCCLSTAAFTNRLSHSSHFAAESPCNDWCCLHACLVRNLRSHSEHWYSTRLSTKVTLYLKTPSIQNIIPACLLLMIINLSIRVHLY